MKKILIIEDEQLLREAFEFLLRSEGYEVVSAVNGKAGLSELKKHKPDVVLLDMLMPVMKGLDFLKAADIRDNYPDTCIIILSNLSDSLSVAEARQYNVKKILIKADLSPAELVTVVKKCLKS